MSTTRRRTDGVILCAPRLPQDELDRLVGGLRPVVLINRSAGEAPSARADYRSALTAELEHLHGLGHRRIVYLAGAPRSVANAARLAAIAEFVAEHPDTEVDEIFVVLSGSGAVTFEDGSQIDLKPGVVVQLRAGDRTRWTIREPLRKVYVIA